MNILDEIIANKRREIETPGYFQTLETVVETLEAGDLPLEDALEKFDASLDSKNNPLKTEFENKAKPFLGDK